MDGALEQHTPARNTPTPLEQGGAEFTEGCDTKATSRPQTRLLTQQSIEAFLLSRGRADENKGSHDSNKIVKNDPFDEGGGNVVMDSNAETNGLKNTQVDNIEHLDSTIVGQDNSEDKDTMGPTAPSNVAAVGTRLSKNFELLDVSPKTVKTTFLVGEMKGKGDTSDENVDAEDIMMMKNGDNDKGDVHDDEVIPNEIEGDELMGGGSGDRMVMCEFKRGICQRHKLKGEKKVTKTRVWRKKKFGFGYVTTTKTTYSCRLQNVQPAAPEQRPGSSIASSLSPEIANSNGAYFQNVQKFCFK